MAMVARCKDCGVHGSARAGNACLKFRLSENAALNKMPGHNRWTHTIVRNASLH